MRKDPRINNPECRICGERIGYDKWISLCPFCRRAWARGAFWSGLVVGGVAAIIQHWETIAGVFK